MSCINAQLSMEENPSTLQIHKPFGPSRAPWSESMRCWYTASR